MSEYHDKKYPQSEALDRRLREMSSTGLSIEATAKTMRLPQEVVSKWRKRLGINVRETSDLWHSQAAVDALKALWPVPGMAAPAIARVIAKITGRKSVSRNCVIGKANRLGLGEKPKRGTGNFSGVTTIAPPHVRAAARPPKAIPAPAPEMQRILVPGKAPMALIPLIEFKDGMCRWPIGDPLSASFSFCGCKTRIGATYCQHHARIAYQPVQRRAKPNMETVAA
jgi:GcrA cell cycle regulator